MTHHLFLASKPSFLLFSEELFSDTRLSQQPLHGDEGEINHFEAIMQNKPNLCVFWAVSGDCEEKQTQFKPNSNPIKAKTKPIRSQFKPNFGVPYGRHPAPNRFLVPYIWCGANPNKPQKPQRRGRDSNPRYGRSPIRRFSKPLPSATRPPLQNFICSTLQHFRQIAN